MGIARNAGLPVLVVGDIDRGGVFASFFGTVALLVARGPGADRRVPRQQVPRGRLAAGARGWTCCTGSPGGTTYGVLPFRHGLGIDEEDGLRVSLRGRRPGVRASLRRSARTCCGSPSAPCRSCPTSPTWTRWPPSRASWCGSWTGRRSWPTPTSSSCPGTRGTVRALEWLRERGLADALARRAAEQRPVLGICGGFQILGEHIEDDVESRRGHVDGLGILPVRVRFAREKTLARPRGRGPRGARRGVRDPSRGRRSPAAEKPSWTAAGSARSGARTGTARWSRDGFRRAFLREVAAAAGRRFVPAPDTSFAALREEQLDRLGDLIEQHADTDALWRLIESGAPQGLPFIPPGAPA